MTAEPEAKIFEGDGNNLVSSSIGRPPSSYNNRPSQVTGSHKGIYLSLQSSTKIKIWLIFFVFCFPTVVPGKEWKPKPTNSVPARELGTEVPVVPISIPVEAHSSQKLESSIPDSRESYIPNGQQVIIPNHLHVPEAEKLGFCFGSFDASFGFNSNTLSEPQPMSEKSPSISEASEEVTEHIEEQADRLKTITFCCFYFLLKYFAFTGPIILLDSGIKTCWQLLMTEVTLNVHHPLLTYLKICHLKVTCHLMWALITSSLSKRLLSQRQVINIRWFILLRT